MATVFAFEFLAVGFDFCCAYKEVVKEIAAKMKTEQANGFMINGYGPLKLQLSLIANSS